MHVITLRLRPQAKRTLIVQQELSELCQTACATLNSI